MCVQVTCNKCGKVGWEGCGGHIEEALRGVPEEDRCKCLRLPSHPCKIRNSNSTVEKIDKVV